MRISSIYLVKKILHTNNFIHTLSINGYPNSTLSLLKKKEKNANAKLSQILVSSRSPSLMIESPLLSTEPYTTRS